MIIDAHNHAEWKEYDCETLIKSMDKIGIEKTWLLSWEAFDCKDFGVFSKLNDGSPIFNPHCSTVSVPFLHGLNYKKKAPERFVLGYAPNPNHPNAYECFKTAVEKYGVQVCGEVIFRTPYNNPILLKIFRYCGECHIPVVLHIDLDPPKIKPDGSEITGAWTYGGDITVLENMLSECPETAFLGHASFWRYIYKDYNNPNLPVENSTEFRDSKLEHLLEKHNNLYCDMSANSGYYGISNDRKYSSELISRFPERFLYGRDSIKDIHRDLIDSLGLSESTRRLVYRENALRLMGD